MYTSLEKQSTFAAEESIAKEEDVHSPEQTAEATAEERRVIRKLDIYLLTMIFILYSFVALDRSNIGQAKVAGMEKDLALTDYQYSWLGASYYIADIVFHFFVPAWILFPPHIWISFVIFFIGLTSTLQATASSWVGVAVCRTFLGAAESGFGPGVALYFSFFYPREHLGLRMGLSGMANSLASAYGGAIAYALSSIHRPRVAGWRLLFIVEGVPTCLSVLLLWWFCPDSPATARFLNKRERTVAASIAERQPGDYQHHGLQLRQLGAAFLDYKSYVFASIYFANNVVLSTIPLFLPTIVSELGGFASHQPQSLGLTAPPYLATALLTGAIAWLSDCTRLRAPCSILLLTTSAAGFLILALADSPGIRYFGIFLAVTIYAQAPILITWNANSFSTDSKRAGGSWVFSMIGQGGALVGTRCNLFPKSAAPLYRRGMWIEFACCVIAAVLSVFLCGLLAWENLRKKKQDSSDADGGEIVRVQGGRKIDVGAREDMDVRFRQML